MLRFPKAPMALLGAGLLAAQAAVAAPTIQSHGVVLSVKAEGAPILLYQWYKDGVLLHGQYESSLSLANLQPSQTGTYWVEVLDVEGLTTTLSLPFKVTMGATAGGDETKAGPTSAGGGYGTAAFGKP